MYRLLTCKYDPVVANGNPMGVPAQIADHLTIPFKGFLYVYMPEPCIGFFFKELYTVVQAFIFFR